MSCDPLAAATDPQTSLSDLVGLLEAMREAEWVKAAPSTPSSQLDESVEVRVPSVGAGEEYR